MDMISRLKNPKYYIDFDTKCLCDELNQILEITSPTHYKLLLVFASNAGSRCSKDFYIEKCWDEDGESCSDSNWYSTFSHLRHLHSSLDESFDVNRNGIKYLGTLISPPKTETVENSMINEELAEIKKRLAQLVQSLIGNEEIFPDFINIVIMCRRLHKLESKEYVLEQLGICRRLAEEREQYDDCTLSFLDWLEEYISAHVRLSKIREEIKENEEKMYAARTIERRKRLFKENQDLQKRYADALNTLMMCDEELEKILDEGMQKSSVLSLNKSIRPGET